MSLRFREAMQPAGQHQLVIGAQRRAWSVAALAVLVALTTSFGGPTRRSLRVCADPNNLPFSNRRGEGLENRLAQLMGEALDARVEYEWWTQRRGFVRNTLNAGLCDAVMSVPTSFDLVLRTNPYYRSTYVFVTRDDMHPPITTFDDPRLQSLKIGVQMIGDDGANTPPAHALTRRGIVGNVRGFMVFGDYAREEPQAPIIRAVERGEIDVAVAWGPTASFFARRSRVPLRVTPVLPQIEQPFLPFVFDIAIGVRRGDSTLRAELDAALIQRRSDVERLLDDFAVPRVTATRRTATP